MIIVVRRLDPDRAVEIAQAAPGGDRLNRIVAGFGEQLRHTHTQPLAQFVELVVS